MRRTAQSKRTFRPGKGDFMQIALECYPCILGHAAKLAGEAGGDRSEQLKLVKRFLRIAADADELTSPPEMAACFNGIMSQITGISDPFAAEKAKATKLGLELLPELRKMRDSSADPFETAVRLSIGGNIIDYGVMPDFRLDTAEQKILQVMDMALDRNSLERLRQAVEKAKKIFFMLDNCGEAVIDNLLTDFFREKAVIGVRGRPIYNDATREDAVLSGFGDMEIFDTGDNAPGVVLRRTSPEFREAMDSCDLVIAKGQGNFETLDAYPHRVFHLLRVKCPVICSALNAPLGSLQIYEHASV